MSFIIDIVKILKAKSIDYGIKPVYNLRAGVIDTDFRFTSDHIMSKPEEYIEPNHTVGAIPSDIAIIIAPCVKVNFKMKRHGGNGSFYFSVYRDEPGVIRGRESDFDPDISKLLKEKGYMIIQE